MPARLPTLTRLDRKEIEALIRLLDDTDSEVVNRVTSKLISFGDDVLPILEDKYLADPDPEMQERIHDIIDKIHHSDLTGQLVSWAADGAHDLFEGFFLISKSRYPELRRAPLNTELNKIKLDIWLELNFQLSPLDKVRVFNQVFYERYGFRGNTDEYHCPDNSYLNRVLETHKGNPISLAIVYSIIAQRLNIPVFGVNLPQHFILAYKYDPTLLESLEKKDLYTAGNELRYDMPGDILFYINAFNKGSMFTRPNIEDFLRQIKIDPQPVFFEPCSNVDILLRVIRNLLYAYELKKDETQSDILKHLMDVLQPFSSIG